MRVKLLIEPCKIPLWIAVISGDLITVADGESVGRVREDHLCGEFRILGRLNKVQSDTHSGQGSLGKLLRHDIRQLIMILLLTQLGEILGGVGVP